ncbi:MAG: radical SAM protein [Lentisphaeria bacterium]|nr:radical SAM protein [Lentisphaeria bacterium]
MQPKPLKPTVIAWELTRSCYLSCKHCRGAALNKDYTGEFTTEECKKVIDNIATFSSPILIMTGGEPMMRDDIFELIEYASALGIKPVLATCGHMVDLTTAQKLKKAGILAVSISIDGSTPEAHDDFRGIKGAYAKTMEGLNNIIEAGIPFQVNVTVTKHNVDDLPKILDKAIELGAKTLDCFFLVPTGRGSTLHDQEISPEQHESALQWVQKVSQTAPIRVKTTCAPHYARVQKQAKVSSKPKAHPHAMPSAQKSGHPGHPGKPGHPHGDPNYVSGGCMAGQGFVFISHRGILQGCGFLDIPCGDLRKNNYDFKTLYLESPVFNALRKPDDYNGKCGICEYRKVCGGCRARAYAHTGNYLDEEPGCTYIPKHGK